MGTNRDRYADFVKGSVILLVLLGHSIQYGNGLYFLENAVFFDNIVFKLIYAFHMPLFMIVSGFFSAYSIGKYGSKRFFLKKCRSILIPIFVWGLFYKYNVMSTLYMIKGHASVFDMMESYFSTVVFNNFLWFLWSILLNSFFVAVVHRFRDSLFVYTIIWILLLFIPDRGAMYSFMYPYFILGYMANKYRLTDRNMGHISLLALSAFALFSVCMFFFDRESYVYVSGQNICRDHGLHYLLLDIFRFFIGLAGSIFVFCSVKQIFLCKNNLQSPFITGMAFIGECSMGIYCFQEIFFSWFGRYLAPLIPDAHSMNYLTTAIVFLGAFSFSFGCTYIARKHGLLRTLLLGGR